MVRWGRGNGTGTETLTKKSMLSERGHDVSPPPLDRGTGQSCSQKEEEWLSRCGDVRAQDVEGGAFEASGVGCYPGWGSGRFQKENKWRKQTTQGPLGCWRMVLLAGEMCTLRQRHWVLPEGGKTGVNEQSNKMPGPGR